MHFAGRPHLKLVEGLEGALSNTRSVGGRVVSRQVGVGDPLAGTTFSSTSSSSPSSGLPRPVSVASSSFQVACGPRADAFVQQACSSKYVKAHGIDDANILRAREQFTPNVVRDFDAKTVRVIGCKSASCYFQMPTSKPDDVNTEQSEQSAHADSPFF